LRGAPSAVAARGMVGRGRGGPPHAEGLLDPAITTERQGEGGAEGLSERLDRLGLVLEVDAEHLKPLTFELPRQRSPGGSLPPAARSGRVEESDEDDLAAQIGEPDRAPAEPRNRDVGHGNTRGRQSGW